MGGRICFASTEDIPRQMPFGTRRPSGWTWVPSPRASLPHQVGLGAEEGKG